MTPLTKIAELKEGAVNMNTIHISMQLPPYTPRKGDTWKRGNEKLMLEKCLKDYDGQSMEWRAHYKYRPVCFSWPTSWNTTTVIPSALESEGWVLVSRGPEDANTAKEAQ